MFTFRSLAVDCIHNSIWWWKMHTLFSHHNSTSSSTPNIHYFQSGDGNSIINTWSGDGHSIITIKNGDKKHFTQPNLEGWVGIIELASRGRTQCIATLCLSFSALLSLVLMEKKYTHFLHSLPLQPWVHKLIFKGMKWAYSWSRYHFLDIGLKDFVYVIYQIHNLHGIYSNVKIWIIQIMKVHMVVDVTMHQYFGEKPKM